MPDQGRVVGTLETFLKCYTQSFCFCYLGGLFHPGDNNQEIAFRYAVDKINLDRTILPRSKLTTQVEIISPQDSFHASKRGNVLYSYSAFTSFCHCTIPYSVPFIENRRSRNIWAAITTDGQPCSEYLRYNGGATFGNPMGLSIETRKLFGEFVSASQHPVKGMCDTLCVCVY